MDTNTLLSKILIGGNIALLLMSVLLLGLAVVYLFKNDIDHANWNSSANMLIRGIAIVGIALKVIPEVYLKQQNITPDMSQTFIPEFLLLHSYEFVIFSIMVFLIIFQIKRISLRKK